MKREDLVLTPRALYGAAAALALAGLVLRLAPAGMPDIGPAPALPAAAQPTEVRVSPGNASSYTQIAAGNVFSRTRKAPTVRFVPEGRAGQEPAAAPPPKPRQPVYRLFGITVNADGAIALIDADPKVRGAELYRVGDRIGGAVITAITDSTVVIRRAGGPLILRLRSAERPPR
jgi:hypothetical protein